MWEHNRLGVNELFHTVWQSLIKSHIFFLADSKILLNLLPSGLYGQSSACHSAFTRAEPFFGVFLALRHIFLGWFRGCFELYILFSSILSQFITKNFRIRCDFTHGHKFRCVGKIPSTLQLFRVVCCNEANEYESFSTQLLNCTSTFNQLTQVPPFQRVMMPPPQPN